jgi:hypothetical protein
MKKLFALLLLLFAVHVSLTFAQDFQSKSYSIERQFTVDPKNIEPDFNFEIKNLEAPLPDGDSYRSFLIRQKQEALLYHRQQKKTNPAIPFKSNMEPIIGETFIPVRYTSTSALPIYGGIPSDNTLAVSNDGIAMVSMNSVIYARDLVLDTAVFPNYQVFLRQLVNGSPSSSYYDPKLFYDPQADRFILALLKDFTPAQSEVIICFSSTNNPNDAWHIYKLPGNPLDNNRWTDFPAIAVTSDKLYFTANLIIPNVSWQVGFDGSVIWEMDKFAGYNGETSIDAQLYHDIKFNDRFIRNLHPVQGADGVADELILLSNRNFDIVNDTVFFLRMQNGTLDIQALKTDMPYGVPPNARQQDTDTSDPNNGLQTNDARVLGAIKFDDQIQYVANTMNPETGFSAIYHGIIDLEAADLEVKGMIIGDTVKDYGYPNIAWSGNENCDRETIIAFNFSSFTHFPGTATIYYSNEGAYSNVKTIQDGFNYVDRLPGGYERWGDYFGLQRQYNKPGTVHSFGYLAMLNRSNSGFFATLISPDSTEMQVALTFNNPNGGCNNTANVQITGGQSPYTINNSTTSGTQNNLATFSGICAGDTITTTVTDARGCSIMVQQVLPKNELAPGINVYPNPSDDAVAVQFNLEKDAMIAIELFDMSGKLVKRIDAQPVKQGLNELTFSIAPLSAGLYSLVLIEDGKIGQTFKVLKR